MRSVVTCFLLRYLRMPYEPDPGKDSTEQLAFQASREVRHTVIRVIGAHLKKDAAVSWQGRSFDFNGVVFDSGDFRRRRVLRRHGRLRRRRVLRWHSQLPKRQVLRRRSQLLRHQVLRRQDRIQRRGRLVMPAYIPLDGEASFRGAAPYFGSCLIPNLPGGPYSLHTGSPGHSRSPCSITCC
jgi:hypothetical protein